MKRWPIVTGQVSLTLIYLHLLILASIQFELDLLLVCAISIYSVLYLYIVCYIYI